MDGKGGDTSPSVNGEIFTFQGLGFAEVPMQRYSSRGSQWTKMVPIGMPRINPQLLNMACYLYHSREDAEAGRHFGGTAFLVSVPTVRPDLSFIYAVTNWHVAVRDGASVLRMNTTDGGVDIFEFGPEDWFFNPKYDIAIRPLAGLDEGKHLRAQFKTDGFVSRQQIAEARLTAGEDVFMIGRFIDHDGGGVNFPTVRFGNISAMPTPIKQPNGRTADAFLLDMHSRQGYSGSPVFIYRTPGFDLEQFANGALLLAGANYLALLGIHFAQFPEEWEITEGSKPTTTASGVPLIYEGKFVSGLSGMTCVLPAWNILEVLDMPEPKAGRDLANATLAGTMGAESAPLAEGVANEAAIAARRDAVIAKALNSPPDPRVSKSEPKGA